MVQGKPKDEKIHNVRFKPELWERMEKVAKNIGFNSVSEFVRFNMTQIVKEEESQR